MRPKACSCRKMRLRRTNSEFVRRNLSGAAVPATFAARAHPPLASPSMAGLLSDWLNPFSRGTGTPTGRGGATRPPGQARGLLPLLRSVGGWLGPRLSRGTPADIELRSEKVAGGPRNIVLPNFLPFYDDPTGETLAMRRAYRQMLVDPNVKAAVLSKVLGVAALDLQVQPANKKSQRDQEVAEFVKWTLTERVQDCLPGLVWAVLSGGLIDGYSVAEKVWQPEERGRYAGKIALTALKPKDTGNDLVLLTDEFKNVVGVQGLRYNPGVVFHPANFLIYTHLGLYGKPTGQSDLRAAYKAYWILDTVWKLRAICLEKRAIPILVGEYASESQQPSLERALALAKSQFWISLPKDAKFQAVSIAGSAESDFKSAVSDLKHDIFLGVQGAILQNLEGDTTDGRGDSQVHKSTSDLFRWHLSSAIGTLLNDRDNGLIRDVVDLNYVVQDYPRATLSAVDVNEQKAELEIDKGLHEMGLDLSKEELYERYGRKPPDPNNPDDKLAGGGQQGGGQGGPDGAGAGGFPFADAFDDDPEAFCQEGANKGKPGPCPEGDAATAPTPRRAQQRRQNLPANAGIDATTGAQARKKAKRQAAAGGTPQPAPGTPQHAAAKKSVVARLIEGTKDLAARAQAIGKRLGDRAWNALPPRVQNTITAVEHKLNTVYDASQKMVTQVARERGLNVEHVARVAKIAATVDLVARWTVNIPIVHEGLHLTGIGGAAGFMAAKVGYYIPVGSLAYLGYSTAVNPLATIRAARSIIGAVRTATGHADASLHDAIATLLERLDGPNGDWYEALLHAALDATGDLPTAIEMADAAIEDSPEAPEDDDSDAGDDEDELDGDAVAADLGLDDDADDHDDSSASGTVDVLTQRPRKLFADDAPARGVPAHRPFRFTEEWERYVNGGGRGTGQ